MSSTEILKQAEEEIRQLLFHLPRWKLALVYKFLYNHPGGEFRISILESVIEKGIAEEKLRVKQELGDLTFLTIEVSASEAGDRALCPATKDEVDVEKRCKYVIPIEGGLFIGTLGLVGKHFHPSGWITQPAVCTGSYRLVPLKE